jgi:hypothetical protein
MIRAISAFAVAAVGAAFLYEQRARREEAVQQQLAILERRIQESHNGK